MEIDVDPKGLEPPSEQIADQLRGAIASERVVSGDRLPSVRALAASARVNPNTVAKAYRELEREGTVSTRPGAGVWVADGARDQCRAHCERRLRLRVERVLRDALHAGLTTVTLRSFVATVLEPDDDVQEPQRRAS